MQPVFHQLNRHLLKTPIALGVALALQQPSAVAQEARLEEVLVTATRRAVTVQDIPYNINVVTGEQLRAAGISDVVELVRLVPGLTILNEGPRVSGNRNTYNLRGMNVDAAGNEDDNPRISQATVSTYLGEVPMFFPMKLVDIARVEVLRGPQGTLYGASSVGGTIRFMPEAPRLDETTVQLMGEFSQTEESGDLNYDGNIVVNLPLSEQLAFRGYFGQERLAGFIDAVDLIEQTGTPRSPGEIVLQDPNDILGSPAIRGGVIKDSNESEQTYFRGSLLFRPSDLIEATLNYHFQEVEVDNRYEDNRFFGDGEDYKTYKAFTDPQDGELSLINLDVQADLGFARLTSATGYTEIDIDSVSDSSGFLRINLPQYYFGFPRLFAPLSRSQSTETFTQELRLVSTGDGPIDWVAGVFYMENKLDFTMLQIASGLNDYTNAYFGTPAPVDFTDVLARGGTNQEFTDLAAFAEVTWHVTDRWQVTGGIRVFDQELDGSSGIPLPYASRTFEYYYYGTATDDFLLGGINPTEYEVDEEILKFNTSFEVSDDMLIFATFAEGFRPGGANQLPETDPFGNDNSAILEFQPDVVDNYEVGIKGTIDDRFTYTATAFYMDWDDFQATLASPFGIAYIDNVPGAESKGLELELSGYLGSSFDFTLGYFYVDAEISEDFNFVAGDPSSVIEAGTSLPAVPEHELFGAANYRFGFGDSTLTFHLDASYRGETRSNFRDLPNYPLENFAELDAFTIWNASISWETGPYRVWLFGENLSNERGETLVTAEDAYGPRDQARGVTRPRTFGLRFSYFWE
jgi:outer membrane receptor protein involved in Fe transport